MPTDTLPLPKHGQTPSEFGRFARMSPDRVRAMIQRGELGAVNIAPDCRGKPRYIILPCHIDAWVRAHAAATPHKPVPRRRRRAADEEDFYPD